MCVVLGRGFLEILTKGNVTSRAWLRLERARLGKNLHLDFENGREDILVLRAGT